MATPILYLLAGPNGAGKSTVYHAVVADGLIPVDAEFVNADLHEATHLHHLPDAQARSEAARQWADDRRATLLKGDQSFVSETVFSHPSKLDLIRQAQQLGFAVVLLVVCLDNPTRLLARVQQRVLEGGHDVPSERILARYPRTLRNLATAIRLADIALLYDTGSDTQDQISPPLRIAVCRGWETKRLVPLLPEWAQVVLGDAATH